MAEWTQKCELEKPGTNLGISNGKKPHPRSSSQAPPPPHPGGTTVGEMYFSEEIDIFRKITPKKEKT